MLTIFAIPRAFNGHIGVIQRNALRSWTLLTPRPQILLLGDDPGTAEAAREFGVTHVPEIARNEYGTPLFSDIFEQGQRRATAEVVCYANSDMILLDDLVRAVERVRAWRPAFLLGSGRYDVDLTEPWDFDTGDWQARLRAQPRAARQPVISSDYFVFPRGFYRDIPPFAIGRGIHDGWLFWKARQLGAPVVDATRAVCALHQNHDYSYVKGAKPGTVWPWQTEEGGRNAALMDGTRLWFLREATHVMTRRAIVPIVSRKLPVLAREFPVYGLGPLRHALGLRRENLARLRQLLPVRGR